MKNAIVNNFLELRQSLSKGQIIINNDSVLNYNVATKDELNTWNNNNQDRILYGSRIANLVVGNHSASIANINPANDKLNSSIVSVAKRMAHVANPVIRPIEEWFVMFCDPCAFRDLKNDPIINQINSIFTDADGDLIYDGVIIREVPEIGNFANFVAGATASRVGVSFLCGQQAVAFGLGQRPNIEVDLFDYKFKPGLVTIFTSSAEKEGFNV